MAPGSAVFMRSTISKTCSVTNQELALAAIYYDGADTTKTPTSVATPIDDSHCGNVSLITPQLVDFADHVQDPLSQTTPFFPFPATSNPATTVTIGITGHTNSTGHFLWWMNESSFRANYE